MADTPKIKYAFEEKSYQDGFLTVKGRVSCEEMEIDKIFLYGMVGEKKLPLDCGIEIEFSAKDEKGKRVKTIRFSHVSSLGTRRRIHLFLTYMIGVDQYTVKLGSVKRSLAESARIYKKLLTKEKISKACKLAFSGRIKDLVRYLLVQSTPQLTGFESLRVASYKKVRPMLDEAMEEMPPITEPVDVIVPVYNGIRYFEKLFAGIAKTAVPFRLIVIDDKSPDPATYPALEAYVQKFPGSLLLQNEVNKGFVSTVNRGFKESKSHAVILNTDIELPDGWLERLIRPIVMDEKVGSVTPYTNSGTICSFPRLGLDNDCFNELGVEKIDQAFRKIRPIYTPMPTGVGFCMALSRRALDQVGLFDDVTFEKGYGEENDWCQRAIKAGFSNVTAENLYVFHNHGGSFSSEEKLRLGKINSQKLREKHPSYEAEVAEFCSRDPLFDLRGYLTIEVARSTVDTAWLVFNHRLGGGADVFVRQQIRERLKQGQGIYEVGYDYTEGAFLLTAYFGNLKTVLRFETWAELENYLSRLDLQEVCVSELVTYPKLYEKLVSITEIAHSHKARLTMMMHDYFALCPVLNLLEVGPEGLKYCDLPEADFCNQCLKNNPRKNYADYGSIQEWRKNWGLFLEQCDEIRCFSQSTKDLLVRAYSDQLKIRVEGHQVDYMPYFRKEHKTTGDYRIGVVGTMAYHKGQAIVQKVVHRIDEQGIDMKIVHLGSSEEPIEGKCFVQHGRYTPEELPRLIMQYDIDMIWIPSIVPETFSFSTSEAILMDMPLAVFDYGAPPERVRAYKKGLVLPSEDPADIISQFEAVREKILLKEKPWNGKKPVLLLAEEPSYATRYRMEHLMEQWLLQGEAAELHLLGDLKDLSVEDYRAVVLYRCRMIPQLSVFLEKAKGNNPPIWFDIDDFVFDYDAIKEFPLVHTALDMDYETYCRKIRETMDVSDGFFTSTIELKKLIERYYPEKRVVLHRNVASMQMTALSDTAYAHKPVSDGKVHIGYFSGSRTHNYDLELIKPVLVKILSECPEAQLTLGGVLEIPEELRGNVNRVHTFRFTEWYNLPAKLAEMDINLMPLEDTIFHACKSENKWTEAGLVRVPTIASFNEEMSAVIRDGVDGILCRTEEEWYKALKELVENKEKRKRMGEEAYQRILSDHTTQSVPVEVIE